MSNGSTADQTVPLTEAASSAIQMYLERQSTEPTLNQINNERERQMNEIGIPTPFERISAASVSTNVSRANRESNVKTTPHPRWTSAKISAFQDRRNLLSKNPHVLNFHVFKDPNHEILGTHRMKTVDTTKSLVACCNFCGCISIISRGKGYTALLGHLSSCKGGGDGCEYNPKKAWHEAMEFKALKTKSPLGSEVIRSRPSVSRTITSPASVAEDSSTSYNNTTSFDLTTTAGSTSIGTHTTATAITNSTIGTVTNKKKRSQSSVTKFITRTGLPTRLSSSERYEAIKSVVTKWIITSLLPFSTVQDPAFRDVQKIHCSSAPEFGANDVKTRVSMLSKDYRKRIETTLKGEWVTLTTDHWTSPDKKSYCGLTAHWITSHGKLESLTLGCFLYCLEDASAENLREDFLIKLFEDSGLGNTVNVLAVVSDTTASVNRFGMFLEQLEQKIQHIYCVDHVIQLTAKMAYEDYNYESADADLVLLGSVTTMKKARALVQHFTASNKSVEKLKEIQRLMEHYDGIAVSVIVDVVTRWWSTYSMVKRLLYLRPAIDFLFADPASTLNQEKQLTAAEWKILACVEKLLEPFRDAQLYLEGQQYVTVSHTPGMVCMARRALTKVSQVDNDASEEVRRTAALARKMLLNFNKHWRNLHESKFQRKVKRAAGNRQKGIHPFVWLAHVLDPKFKLLFYLTTKSDEMEDALDYSDSEDRESDGALRWNHEQRNIWDYLRNMMVAEQQFAEANAGQLNGENVNEGGAAPILDVAELHVEQSPIQREMKRMNRLNKKSKRYQTPEGVDRADMEIRYYQRLPIPSMESNSLEWWNVHKERLPIMYNLARKILAIPATSAPSERIFSIASRLFGKLRNNLSPDAVSDIIFLRDAMALYGDFHETYGTGLNDPT